MLVDSLVRLVQHSNDESVDTAISVHSLGMTALMCGWHLVLSTVYIGSFCHNESQETMGDRATR